MSLRLPEDEERYQQARRSSQLVDISTLPSLHEFEFWRIVENEYPHTKVSLRGDMLIPKRVCTFDDLLAREYHELFKIIQVLNKQNVYHKIELNFSNTQSVPSIVHFHLQVLKPESRT